MNGHEWPEYVVGLNGVAYRRLEDGTVIDVDDVPVNKADGMRPAWHLKVTGCFGEKVGTPNMNGSFVYYRPIRDPLTSSMVKALAAKQSEDKAG
jgi:hypothetical protein